MRNTVYWQERTQLQPLPRLEGHLGCDALVVGGGITGLTAAALLAERGLGVVVLEAATCGAGATGRSSGFITPDSELQATQLLRRFGVERARQVWQTGMAACREIRASAAAADLQPADSLFVAARRGISRRSGHGERVVRTEHETRLRLGLDSRLYASSRELGECLAGERNRFSAGVRYGGTFSIDPLAFVAGQRRRLLERGVRIFERSPVVALEAGGAATPAGRVDAEAIFVCLDRFAPELRVAPGDVATVQTFLMLSEPLDETTTERLFPAGPLLVWDTDLVYHYFRLTPDNRLLAGGGSAAETYRRAPRHPAAVLRQIRSYLRERLSLESEVRFSHWWPGWIGVTKDFLPLAGRSPSHATHWWALCGAGLPWSAVAARTAVECALDGDAPLADILAPRRAFSEAEVLQPLLRRRATFVLSHLLGKTFGAGDATAIRRRQRFLRLGLLAGLAALVAAWVRRWRRDGGSR